MQKKLSPWCKKAKIAMIQNDISVNDLAEELGCSRCYLSSTLNGTAERILNALDNSSVPISWHEMDRCALQSVIAKELILIDKEAR